MVNRGNLHGMPGVIAALLLTAGLAVLPGCEKGEPLITIDSPAAWLSPMIVGSGSVFMKIDNRGSGDDVLLSANVELPGAITELHDVRDGKMAKTDSIKVPAGSVTELRPGSLHIMIFNMPKTIASGYTATVLLHFEKTGTRNVAITFQNNTDSSRKSHAH